MRGASFWGLGESFNAILFSSQLFIVISPDKLSSHQGTLFFVSDFLRDAVSGDVNPRNKFPRQSVTKKGNLFLVSCFHRQAISSI